LDRHPDVSGLSRTVVVAFTASTVAALALAGVYLAGGQPQLEGAFLLVALGGLGVGLIAWAKDVFGDREVTEPRPGFGSSSEARDAFVETLERGDEAIGRRRLLVGLFATAVGALGVAALFPIASLGPTVGDRLRRTAWRRGSRLVTSQGELVMVDDLPVGGVLTAFPEHSRGSEDSQVILVRVHPDELRMSTERRRWAPRGNVAYSKVCTHVGCPVGLYNETRHELVCPCHQSTFAVLDGARPIRGPATRRLPQLPLRVDGDGHLVARSDFHEPVGPSFWNRDR
jgi:ubiquinol-cytochrome c reductase iron-sulfur subunit